VKPSDVAVLDLLRLRGAAGITDRDALLYAHTSRLAARIFDLKAEGFRIGDEYEVRHGFRYKRYRLIEEPLQLDLGVA
jgi:hypothetical protein